MASPLLPPEPAGDEHVTKTVRFLLANLSRRNSDELSGKLLLAAYQRKLASYPREQISYLCDQALDRCKWFPTIAECLEIMAGWQRNDEALRNRQRAEAAMRNELQARLDETLKRIDAGEVSQDEVDAMPEQWRRIAETLGLLRLNKDRTYTLRQRRAVAQIHSNEPVRCGECQGVGRVMALDGAKADCSCAEKQELAA